MIFDNVIVPLVSGAAGAMALRLVLFAAETLRAPKPAPVSPSRALGADRGGPYRALIDAGAPDHAQLALDLADEAVRRERERMNGIARAVVAGMTPGRGLAEVQAIIDAIDARPLPMPVPGTGAARK